MKTTLLFLGCLLVAGACSHEAPVSPAPAPAQTAVPVRDPEGRRGFDRMTPGALPEGWRVAGTHQEGPLATWSVVADPGASSLPHVLALTSSTHGSGSTFNLCWDERARFKDGVYELVFRADGGTSDQGGGPLWRLVDENNYYLCRANPLESNFRLYVVKDGERKQLASAEAEIASGTWHTIHVEHKGPHIVCTLDDKVRLEADDASLPDAGAVGLWTKADAQTAFDDLTVRPAQ